MVTTPRISFEKQEAFSSREKTSQGGKKKTAEGKKQRAAPSNFWRRVDGNKTLFRFILMDERAEFILFFFYLRKEKKQITCTSIH